MVGRSSTVRRSGISENWRKKEHGDTCEVSRAAGSASSGQCVKNKAAATREERRRCASTVCQACLHPSTPPFIESCAVGYFDYHRFKRDARSTPGGVLGLFLTSCECSESWTLEALLVTSLAFLLTPFPSVSLWFPLLPLITTFQFSQASNSPTVSSIWLLTLPPRRGPDLHPLVEVLDGLGRHAWPQMPLNTAGGMVVGPSKSGCDLPGPSVKTNASLDALGLGHSHPLHC